MAVRVPRLDHSLRVPKRGTKVRMLLRGLRFAFEPLDPLIDGGVPLPFVVSALVEVGSVVGPRSNLCFRFSALRANVYFIAVFGKALAASLAHTDHYRSNRLGSCSGLGRRLAVRHRRKEKRVNAKKAS